jgi:hypothetical protein
MSLVVRGRQEFKFSDRLRPGLEFESRVERIFSKSGLRIYPYGLGTLPDRAKDNIVGLKDPTSLLLRFTPDYYCIIPYRFTFLIECKSNKVSSPYYSYSLDSYESGLRLADLGIRILVVFSGLQAQWIEKLPVVRVVTDKDDLRLVNGSGRPFMLISKAKLPTLALVLKELMKTKNVT